MNPRLAWLMPALPALAAAALMLSGRRQPARGAWLACGATGASLVLSCLVLARVLPRPGRVVETSQVIATAGPVTVTVGTRVGGLAAVVAVMVCVVAFLVQVYSVGYMRADPRYPSYAGYVSLFTAAMLIVVLAADLLELLVGWEVMGFCSYALIGHHWEERTASDAAIKAFLTTRFGDLFFTVGLFVLGIGAGTFRVSGVLAAVGEGRLSHGELTAAGLLLLGGVAGKSAQFPLQTWLPDAMAGPTPISALIHAATMVAAGVYVVALLYPVVVASAVTVDVLALVAAVTMLFGALAACAHDDIKKVLAWSTVSQLAYMTGGLAVGGWAAGLFHLLTHAAFKALLFLGAGAVIHAVGTNSMHAMGGLRRPLPLTFACTTVGLAALVGL
ncbi:MAG TPA: proton-conducting transporter membrane subunit, partial [Frankiaceae bacterium]|nr:proton-conducting transporter membrane subunit [Frankiaceae bacterium]